MEFTSHDTVVSLMPCQPETDSAIANKHAVSCGQAFAFTVLNDFLNRPPCT